MTLALLAACGAALLLAGACSGAAGPASGPGPALDASPTDALVGPSATDAPPAPCVDGQPGPYPASSSLDLAAVVPDLTFAAPSGPLALRTFYEPCAPRARLLVLREVAGFCEGCRWSLAHTADLIPPELRERVEVVDLVVSDEHNFPVATPADLARAAKALPGLSPVHAADPRFTFGPVGLADRRLPFLVAVERRTMKIVQFLVDPAPEDARFTLRQTIAALDGVPAPAPEPLAVVDGLFPQNHWALVQNMRTPGAPPPDPTNAVADDPAAAALGKRLFHDATLTPSGTVSCATCHAPEKGFADGRARGFGLTEGDRHTPSATLAAHARFQFWDGRSDTLWHQALGPFENASEMGSSRLFVARRVGSAYAAEYAAVFPRAPLPAMGDLARFPTNGKPGEPSWDGMAAADRDAVTRVYVNVGKAIAAYERTLRVRPGALDRYAAGDLTALTPAQKTGLHVFFLAGCAQCHHGPRLTDDAFHALRFETGRRDGKPDRGALDGLAALLADPIRREAALYYDAPPPALPFTVVPGSMLGAFKTPTLRGVASRAPYGHGGTLADLAAVSKHYGERGLAADDPRTVGDTEPWAVRFIPQHADEITELMRVLDEASIEP
ncbi:MAG: hypothetical protein IPF92_21910 [Myxococcales bacterium]|nr:hypothetical protein [Myxococcales bacterium]